MISRRCHPIRLRLWLGVLASIALGSAAWAQPVPQTLSGVLTIVWGDPRPDTTGGETRYQLHLADGRTLLLQVGDSASLASMYFGRPVTVTGAVSTVADPASGVAREVMTVDTMTLVDQPTAVEPSAVLGTKKVIYLLVKFSDDTSVPHPPSFYTNLNNPDTPPGGEVFPTTLNGFFKKTSYNQFSWVGDVGGVGGVGAPGGWLTLSQPKSFYAPCGWASVCFNHTVLSNEAYALGKAQGINFTLYDNINFVLSNDVDCCAWGGGYYNSGDAKSFGATWEPPWGQETGVYAHEMGHSLGLPHSGWVYYAYDSPWDMMSSTRSAASVLCGSYFSRNSGAARSLFCTEPGDGYIAPHKNFLGWFPPANVATVNPGSSTTVTVEANALTLGSAVKMIKICLPGLSCSAYPARYFTVEVRVKGLGASSQYDNGISGEGVIIHDVKTDRAPISGTCYFNSQSGWAVPADATPGDYDGAPTCSSGTRVFPNYALFNAQFAAGQSYTNSTFGITVTIISRSGSTFEIRVDNNAAPTITTHPANQTILSGQTATLSVVAASSSALSYQWYLGASGVTTAPIAGAAASSYTTGARISTALFWVRVSNTGGAVNSNAGEITVAFTDNALTAGVSTVKAVHVTELRTRINGLRQRHGLENFTWTRTLTIGASVIMAGDISELRVALLQAYTAAGVSAPTFTDASLSGVVIKRAHITELRNAVHGLELR